MTTKVEQTLELAAPPDRVWAFISDPAKRANAVSVVEDFEITGENTATWHLSLPIPVLNRTVAVETEEVEREEGRYVKFVGESRVMTVTGEHELEPTSGGEATRLVNTLTVDGKAPGVERFFKRNFHDEVDNLNDALRADLDVEA